MMKQVTNVTFTAVYLSTPPWFGIKENSDGFQYVYGPFANILQHAVENYNISINYLECATGKYGIPDKNGSWSDLVGMITKNEADLSASPLVISYSRSQVLRYSHYVSTLHLAVLGGDPHIEEQKNVFGYFMTFDLEVWIVILIALFVSVIVSCVIDYVHGRKKSLSYTFMIYATEHFGMLFLEGSERPIEIQSARLLRAFLWLAILVLMNAFQGHFKSSITLKSETPRINNLADLVKRDKVVPMIWQGVSYEEFFKTSTSVEIQQIMQRVYNGNGITPTHQLFSKAMVDMVLKGQNVILNEMTITKARTAQFCDAQIGELYFAKETFYPHNFAIAFRKSFPDYWFNKINKVIEAAVETGLIEKWLTDQEFGSWTKCTQGFVTEEREVSLGLKEFGNFFVLYFIFLIGASFVLVFENIYFLWGKKKGTRIQNDYTPSMQR